LNPVAVRRKRFAAPEFDFIFGMIHSTHLFRPRPLVPEAA
jgi:hypothetical protein